ncbi:MAG: hypothetical protein UZ21_OP11001000939 [Microgenomates bacterium OLB22]|nr:MAG: hypothetical protein UZ21_OP11001000939 [Microgenomates bacterium OLB22]
MFLFSLSLLSLLSFTTPTHASQQQPISLVKVYPSILSLSLQPGKTTQYKVYVNNVSKSPLPLHLSFESFQLHDDDQANQGRVPSIGDWTSFTPEDMLLAAGETRSVLITTALPGKIPLGGYYGNLIIEPKSAPSSKSLASAQIQPRLVVLLLGNVGVPKASSKNGTIQNIKIPLVQTSPLIEAHFSVKIQLSTIFQQNPS